MATHLRSESDTRFGASSCPGQAEPVSSVHTIRDVKARSLGTMEEGNGGNPTHTMKKNRAARRREAGEAEKKSPSGQSSGLVPISKVNPNAYTVALVRTVIEKYREMQEASRRLQQLGTLLYLDKFRFEPNVPFGYRLLFHDRLQSSMEDLAVKGRHVVILAGATSLPQEAIDLVKQFAAEN